MSTVREPERVGGDEHGRFCADALATGKEAASLMSDATSVNGTLDRRRWLVLGVIGPAHRC
jgi:hypothetical protein